MTSAPAHLALDQPSAWVKRFAPMIPKEGNGEVLDLACGSGRHARLLAALGYRVLAVDCDEAALEKTASQVVGIATQAIDLEQGPEEDVDRLLAPGRFAGIVVTNYLHRPLLPRLCASLRSGGVLIYETFALGNERFGKPSNPDFLLRPAELLQVAAAALPEPLDVAAYQAGIVHDPRPASVQRLCAVRNHGAPVTLPFAPDALAKLSP